MARLKFGLGLAIIFITFTCKTFKPKPERISIILPYYPNIRLNNNLPIQKFISEELANFKGQNICLVTNQAGIGRLLYHKPGNKKYPTLLHEYFAESGGDLIKTFTPEHGLSGQAKAHGKQTGKKKFYLETIYFKTADQIAKLFVDCQAVIYSLPDAGVRPFTYRTIFTRTISAFDKVSKKKPGNTYWMLDVPNPASYLNSRGPLVQKFSYLGEEKIPFFPAYTYGELARYYHSDQKLTVNLKIHQLDSYRHSDHFLETGHPFVQPSPNLPTFRSLQCYWMAVILEGNYFDLGRNSNDPFCLIGHPDFSNNVNLPAMPGIRWEVYNYIPWGGRYKGKLIHAYRMIIENPNKYQPLKSAYNFILFTRRNFASISMFKAGKNKIYWLDQLTGSDRMRKSLEKKLTYEDFMEPEHEYLERYNAAMEKHILYE